MTRLSNRQYPMLHALVDLNSRQEFMSIEQAQAFDQRPFRSMLVQGWVTYGRGGFHITKAGLAAWSEFQNTDIARKDPTRPLTAYFDASAYKPRIVKRNAA